MNLTLAPNERLIKDWRYATEKSKSDNEHYFIAVTNKRVVFGSNYKGGFSHDEILLEHVQGISTFYEKGISLGYVALCILGLCLAVAGAIAFWNSLYWLIGFVAVGVILIIAGIIAVLKSRRVQFGVSIFTSINHSLGIEKNSSLRRTPIQKQVTKIIVDPQIAREIVETLGSIIVAKNH